MQREGSFKMKKQEKGKKIWIPGISLLLLRILFISAGLIALLFALKNPIKELCKKYVFYEVIKHEDELSQLIGRYTECAKENGDFYIHISNRDERSNRVFYKKLEDKQVSDAFKRFNLIAIRYDQEGNITFTVYPHIGLLIEGYSYGFYYSEQDEPIKGAIEIEEEGFRRYQWHRTEKIIDHWWYYEEINLIRDN